MTSRLPLPIVAGALALAATAGCGEQTCAIPGCAPESVVLAASSPCWPEGAYELRGTRDGVAFSVPFTLPAAAGGSAWTGLGGVAVTASDRGLETITVEGTPATVELELLHEGATFDRETFTAIRYEDRLAGGGDCEPTNCGRGAELAWSLEPEACLADRAPGDEAP